MQLTMEPLEEMLASGARWRRPEWTPSGSPRRTPGGASTGWRRVPRPASAALMAHQTGGSRSAGGSSRRRRGIPSGRDGRSRRAGGGRPRPVHPRLRDVEDLSQQHEDADEEDARADARRGDDRPGVLSGERFDYDGDTWSADVPAMAPTRTRRARCRRSTWPRPRRRCSSSPARSRRLPHSLDHDACFVRYTRTTSAARSTSAAPSSPRSTRATATPAATARARSRACTSRTRCRTSRARRHAARARRDRAGRDPAVAEAMERGGTPRREGRGLGRAPRQVPADRGHPVGLHRGDRGVPDAGCTHVMLELWGANRHEQIRLFGEKVLPQFRG
jgi:hypothetical protein